MKALKYTATLCMALLLSFNLIAQTKKQVKEEEFKKLIESKNFVFQAQYANPLGGGHRYLNYDYDLRVKPDSLISYLPYFGRVTFDPPYNPSDDGIKFTSTKFTYKSIVRKNGGYVITLTPSDAKYIQRMIITAFSNGSASLQFTITNRDPISYDGNIVESPVKNNLAAQKQ